jgi:murein DD-endopeptidase MepM/ murein hydrolase activator NlpD
MHRSRALLSFTLSVCLLMGTVAPAWALSRSDIEAHQAAADAARKKAAAAEKTANQLAEEVADLDKRIEKLQGEAEALEPKIERASKRTDQLKSEVRRLKYECESTQAQIDKTQAEYDTQRALLADRVETSYKQGAWFYLDILLGSTDFNDLIARTTLVNRVIESNNSIATSLASTRTLLAEAKAKLERSLESVTLKEREAAAVESDLKGLQRARASKAREQAAVQSQKSTLMVDNRKNAKRLRALAEAEEAESDRIAAMLAGGGSGKFYGTMAWPVPASYRITSKFGWRICPFHGRELHPGIDIGAPSGSAIIAAAKGKVLYAGYRGGYGNTIILDHGNGVTTLYAHQRSGGLRVSTGDSVSKAQRIGTVGSTGNSTGPHLHFEVRVNGVPKNPMSYR